MTLNLSGNPSEKVNWLRERPIAHRGLHDETNDIWENTLTAAAAAVRRDYPIEFDLQFSADRVPMMFHDEGLMRMTGTKGNVRELMSADLRKIKIKESTDHIPTLAELLDLVQGDVGLVIELKGKPEADDGFVESVVRALEGYSGDYVVMSFAHHILEDFRAIAPDMPLGLTAYGEDEEYETHREISEKTNVDFTSYYFKHLETRFVSEFAKTSRPIINWTITSPEDEEYAAQFSDQPTFENYLP